MEVFHFLISIVILQKATKLESVLRPFKGREIYTYALEG